MCYWHALWNHTNDQPDGSAHTVKCSAGNLVVEGLSRKVLVTTIDAQWEGMGDVGSARYEPALLPPWLTIKVVSYSN